MKLALFDFDETLIRENSLGVLFKEVTKKRFLFPDVLPLFFRAKTYSQGIKFSIKRRLYKRCLVNVKEEQLTSAGRVAAARLNPLDNVVERLHNLHEQGYTIWIVTATPTPFVKSIVDTWQWPIAKVIGTELNKNGNIYTGEFGAECMREEKVKRIQKVIDDEQLRPSIGAAYGNLPVDIPMMSLAAESYAVTHGRVSAYRC